MKSIFVPFAQMINFIGHLRKNYPLPFISFLTCILVFVLYLKFYYDYSLWVLPMLLILLILYLFVGAVSKRINEVPVKGRVFQVIDKLLTRFSATKFYQACRKIGSKVVKSKWGPIIVFCLRIIKTSGFFLLFVTFLYLAVIYEFTTKYYNEELDITSYWDWWPRKQENIHIYSGEQMGNYKRIADAIVTNDKEKFFIHPPAASTGGYENPNRVMLDPQGIGFVQEDIYKDGDKMKDQINYIVPLYMEKLHILYDKTSDRFNKDMQARYPDFGLSLGIRDSVLIDVIRQSSVAAGSISSSTKLISSMILAEIGDLRFGRSLDVYAITNERLSDALNNVGSRGIGQSRFDLVFFMAGQSVPEIRRKLLSSDSFGLIGIEPSFVAAINNRYKTNYRNTDFSARYEQLSYGFKYARMPTIGSLSYLIANKNVKPYAIRKFIDQLDQSKGDLGIAFYNFKENYDRDFSARIKKISANLLIGITAGAILGAVILSFIFALISGFYYDQFTDRLAGVISEIPDESIPNEEAKKNGIVREKERYEKSLSDLTAEKKQGHLSNFDLYYREYRNEYGLKSPHIQFFQRELINREIINGMSDLVDLRQDVNKALNEGKVNFEQFSNLIGRTDIIMEKLRKSLFLRLHEVLLRPSVFDGIDKNDVEYGNSIRKQLLKYVTSSYLNFEDYKELDGVIAAQIKGETDGKI